MESCPTYKLPQDQPDSSMCFAFQIHLNLICFAYMPCFLYLKLKQTTVKKATKKFLILNCHLDRDLIFSCF